MVNHDYYMNLRKATILSPKNKALLYDNTW